MIFEIWLASLIVLIVYIIQVRFLEGNYELRNALHLNGVYRVLCTAFSLVHQPLDDCGDGTQWSPDPYNIDTQKRQEYRERERLHQYRMRYEYPEYGK